jgi:hypothetical protein
MTVTADIITKVTSDALVVPSTAVKTDSSGAKNNPKLSGPADGQ